MFRWVKRHRTAAAALATALVAGLAVVGSASAAGQIPEPDDDPFYRVRKGLRDVSPGTILRSRLDITALVGCPGPGP